MFDLVFRSLMSAASGAARRVALRALALVIGAALLIGALVFASVAFFFWLDQHMLAWQAAAIVGAVFGALGLIIVLLAMLSYQRRPHRLAAAPGEPSPLFELGRNFGRQLGVDISPTQMVLLAALAGFLLGRRR
jgi:hypothetical protein